MSLIALAAPVWRVCDFCLIFVPFGHYDEPEILPYEIPLICSIGADVRQMPVRRLRCAAWVMALRICMVILQAVFLLTERSRDS